MTIKDNIKVELFKLINDEENNLERRVQINAISKNDNYDNFCEKQFIDRLKDFIESI